MKKISLYLFLSCIATLLLNGCIKSDTANCDKKATLVIRALGNNGEDITASGETGDALLFAYEQSGKFVSKQYIPASDIQQLKQIPVTIAANASRKFIVWSNITDTIKMLDFLPQRQVAENRIIPLKDAEGFYYIPADIFYGNKTVSYQDVRKEDIIRVEIRRAVSQVHVAVVGMPASENPADYTIVISNDDQAALSFENQVTRVAGVQYKQTPVWMQQGKMMGTRQAFRTLPSASGTSKTVMLYKKTELIASAAQDVNGQPIAPKAGERVNVLIDLNRECNCPTDSGVIELHIVVSDWNEVVQWSNW